jgi:hypothetical protein
MFVNINKKLDGILSASIIVAGILSANIVTANNLNYSLGAYNDFYSEISNRANINNDLFYVEIGNHANKNVNYRVARSTSMDRGFKINGYTADDYSGYSVSNAGDVNGDGLSDVIIGSYRDANSYKGKSFVVFGKTTGASVNLDSTLSGFTINGEYNSYSGWSVSGAGDVNGDGFDDLIVGAYANGNFSGKSYVVFGKNTNSTVNLSDIATNLGGFSIEGEHTGDYSGYSVSGAGDVNGDGFDDLIVGAYAAGSYLGKSYVVFGKSRNTTVNLSNIASIGFVINGGAENVGSGYSVSGAGDVNGDGLDDLIIGVPYGHPSGVNSGKSYVVFGKTTNTAINLESIVANSDGFVIKGEHKGDYSGISVSSAGDVNGDGFDDLIIGAYGYGAYTAGSYLGRSYVVFGKKTADVEAVDLRMLDTVINTSGFIINGESESDESGYSVSKAGDVNGDGLGDLIIGAHYASSKSGKSYVVFGKTNNAIVNLSDISSGIGGFVINGEHENDESGISVSGAGDVNGDGLDDLVIGAYGSSVHGSYSGKSYVVFGKVDTGAINLTNLGNRSKYAIDYLGGEANNSFTGNSSDEIFVSGSGDDILQGKGGMDVFHAGAGNDVIYINVDNAVELEKAGKGNRARIDGGSGIDTIKLDGGGKSAVTLDLTKISDTRIQGIEKIDLSSQYHYDSNVLRLNLNNILNISEAHAGKYILKLLGDGFGRVDLALEGSSFYKSRVEKTQNNISYDVYKNDAAPHMELWIQQHVEIFYYNG